MEEIFGIMKATQASVVIFIFQGVSGGPFMCQLPGQQNWKLFGVTSLPFGCDQSKRFGLYSRVTSYLDWINGIVDQHAKR